MQEGKQEVREVVSIANNGKKHLPCVSSRINVMCFGQGKHLVNFVYTEL